MLSTSQPENRASLGRVASPQATLPPATPLWAAKFATMGFLVAAILAGIVGWQLRRPAPPAIVLHPPPTPAPTAAPLPTATPIPVTVFVSGAVQRPGLYTLPWDARVGDALTAAGGLLPGVDPALVNQAEPLFDGAQIHAPNPDAPEDAQTTPLAAQGPPPGLSGNASSGTGGQLSQAGARVNINTASLEALTSLPGIGPSKAAAIIANRPYASPEELERVPGIGPKTVAQLADLVTTQ